MSFTDRIFDTSSQALALRARRSSMLAANLANADTPGYKARDLDFAAAMRGAEASLAMAVHRTDARHLGASSANSVAVRYRQPLQASVNGNTVEVHREQLAFMDNAIRYQASLGFLDSRIKSVRSTLRGE